MSYANTIFAKSVQALINRLEAYLINERLSEFSGILRHHADRYDEELSRRKYRTGLTRRDYDDDVQEGWRPMSSAPRDGTEIRVKTIYLDHHALDEIDQTSIVKFLSPRFHGKTYSGWFGFKNGIPVVNWNENELICWAPLNEKD